MTAVVTIKPAGRPWLETQARFIASGTNPGTVVLNVETGGCLVHTYATAADLRALAHAATCAADSLDLAAQQEAA